MIIGFVIWSIVSVIFLGIGLNCRKQKEAVGFFTFVKPPTVDAENVKRYNCEVSRMWIVFTIVFEVIGVSMLYAEQNSPIVVFMIPVSMWLVIVTMIAYIRIEDKYKRK